MSSPQLEYAPRPNIQQRFRLRILVLLLVLTAVLAVYRHRDLFILSYRHWRYGVTLRQCLEYTAPKDQVVYDEDANRVGVLLALPGYRTLVPSTNAGTSPVVGYMPDCWRKLEPYTRSVFARGPASVLFMQERKLPTGERVLAVVEATADASGMSFTMDAIDLEAVSRGPRSSWGLGGGVRGYVGGPYEPMTMRIFAGQADQNDPTHFSIPFEYNGHRGNFEVWMIDDPSIKFRVDRRSFEKASYDVAVSGQSTTKPSLP